MSDYQGSKRRGWYNTAMQKSTEQAEEWQAIWERKGALDAFVDYGRSTYNYFFRRVLRRYLTKQSDMLELGCGRASLSLSLAPEIKKLVGVDISETAIQQATASAHKHQLLNTVFFIDDCTGLSLQEKFDFVWSQGLLEHFENPNRVASEHFRMLKPGGAALMSIPYKYSYHALWYILTRPKTLRRFWPWTEQRFFDRKELLAVGNAVTPDTKVFFLHPFFLGIIFLELTCKK